MRFAIHISRSKFVSEAMVATCCVLFAALVLVTSAYSQGTFDTAAEQQLLSLINQERDKEGLPPLELDERLTRAARRHTQLMVRDDSLSHQLDGEEPLQLRVSDQNVRCDHDAENIALDSDVAVAHVMLMQSPHHRDNILSPQFNAVGIGILKSVDLYYITQDFAHVLPNYSEPEADAVAQQSITGYMQSLSVPVPKRRPQPQLNHLACDMALDDRLDSKKVSETPGVTSL